jgi:prepilin signal peptidase PulO-like enzyme (type II secretory pathway)
MILEVVCFIFLIILSLIDLYSFNLKDGAIPSILTTSFILMVMLMTGHYIYVVVGLVMALLLYDLKIYDGEPDIKIFVALSVAMPTIPTIFLLGAIVGVVGLVYKAILRGFKIKRECPFIPAIALSYFVFVMIQYIL